MRLQSSRIALIGALLTVMPYGAGSAAGPGAARAEGPQLGRSDGELAVSEKDAAWRVLSAAEAVPEAARLRTSPEGVCLIELPAGALHLGPSARLEWDAAARRLALSSGRVRLDMDEGDPWRLELPGTRREDGAPLILEAIPPFELDLAVGLGGAALHERPPYTAALLRGQMRLVDAGEERRAPVAAPATVSRDESGAFRVQAVEEPDPEAGTEEIRRATAPSPAASGLGQLVVRDAQAKSRRRLEIARYHVNVVLQPPVALVQIDQSFYNPSFRQEEGTFVFNLPPGASVSRFAMFVTHDTLIEGELIERKRASDIYESIVRSARDPAILEQIGDNLFRMRVFPIFARDTKRILLDYTVPLVPEAGSHRFELPLMADIEPIWDFRITGTIPPPLVPGSAASPTFPQLSFQQRDDGAVTFNWQRHEVRPMQDLVVEFTEPAEEAPRVRGFSVDRPAREDRPPRREDYFLVTVPPERNRDDPTPSPPPADVLLLADTSGGHGSLGPARRAVRTVVNNLRPGDRFQLGCLDADYRPLTEDWIEPDSLAAAAALERLGEQFPLGALSLTSGLNAALPSFGERDAGRRLIVVYVGNLVEAETGFSTTVERGEIAAALEAAGVAFHAVLVRSDASGRALFDRLTRTTGGRTFSLARERGGAGDLFRWALAGLPAAMSLRSVTIDGVESADLFYETVWSPERPLYLYGRKEGSRELALSLTFERDGEEVSRSWDLRLPGDGDDVFTGRLWAQRKLENLLRRRMVRDLQRDAVIALSQEWSLLSPFTAFLVLETEEDYARWQIDRRTRHRYWRPADALPRIPVPERIVRREQEQPVDDGLADVRRALEEGDAWRALRLLERLRSVEDFPETDEFRALERQAQTTVRRDKFLSLAGMHRPLVERGRLAQSVPGAGLTPLVFSDLSQQFLEFHPHARELLARVSSPPAELTVEGLARFVQQQAGMNVIIDYRGLREELISAQAPVDLRGLREVSLGSLLDHALSPLELVAVDEPEALYITTRLHADDRLATRVHRVADLVRSDEAPDKGLLAHPYLDRDRAAEARLRGKLQQAVSVEFEAGTTLADAVDRLARLVDDNVAVDRRALEVEFIDLRTKRLPGPASWRDVPLQKVLDWFCEQTELGYLVANETLVLTTRLEADEHFDVRVHSAHGVVYEVPAAMVWNRKKSWGLGGFSGMGGMGMGGFGGMGGMGMGGMGPAAMGAIGEGSWGAAPAGVAGGFGGVDLVEVPAGAAPRLPDAESDLPFGPAPETPQTVVDDQNVIDAILEGTSGDWMEVNGVGGDLDFYRPSLAFVIRQEQRVHREIEALFDKLRQLPPGGAQVRPATLPEITARQPEGWDLSGLYRLLMRTVGGEWLIEDGVGGTIDEHAATLSLIIRQSTPVQQEVYRVLTELRRHLFALRTGTRPWQPSHGPGLPFFLAEQFSSPLPDDLRLDSLPPPGEAALAALARRRELLEGVREWERTETGVGTSAEPLAIARNGGRLQVDLPERRIRLEGEAAAVGWPRLTLVEHGAWGEAARRLADARLPWMPHRSNEELARLFDVHLVSKDADVTRVRLAFRGPERPRRDPAQESAPPDAAERFRGAWLEAAFSKEHGLPVDWTASLGGEVEYRLRFEDLHTGDGPPVWRTVVAEDAAGREIERWELKDHGDACEPLPPLAEGWEGYVHYRHFGDGTGAEDGARSHYQQALGALRAGDWPGGAAALRAGLREQPNQPLLLLLLAWCHENEPTQVSRDEARQALEGVVARGLARSVTRDVFSFLDAEQLYALLLQQPAEDRAPGDWDRLARAAFDAERFDRALEHVNAALDQAPDARDALERRARRIELLLRLGRTEEAAAAAEALPPIPPGAPGRLAGLPELFARHGEHGVADSLLTKAAAGADLASEQRYHLLVRRASLDLGERRPWLLLEAVETLPRESRLRPNAIESFLADLRNPGTAGELADAAASPDVRIALRMRQAELLAGHPAAVEICWSLFVEGDLPEGRIDWAVALLLWSGSHERVIELLEHRLRAGRPVSSGALRNLAEAYRSAGRETDRRRALSQR